MLGYQLSEIQPVHASWEKLLHPFDAERVNRALQIHLKGHSPLYEVEYRIRTKNGRWRWIQSRGSVVEWDAQGKPLQISGTHLDITDRRQAEAEAHRLLEILEATTDFILTTDLYGRVLYGNRALLKLSGHGDAKEIRGIRLSKFFSASRAANHRKRGDPDRDVPRRMARRGHAARSSRTGNPRFVGHLNSPRRRKTKTDRVSFVMRNISLQKQIEAENIENERRILEVQKSESLGVLAGGIAHDFNNLLTTMLGNANLARMELEPKSPSIPHSLKLKMPRIVRLNCASKCWLTQAAVPLLFTEVDLTALIKDTKQLLQVSISKKIHFELELDPIAACRSGCDLATTANPHESCD